MVCLAVAGAAVGALVGYGIQVADNMQQGMEFGDALTTDIQAETIVKGAFIGAMVPVGVAIVVTAGGMIAGGLTAGGATVGGTATAAACADGDCTNEFKTMVESADYLAKELPQLQGSYEAAFDGTIQQVTLKAGSTLPRVGAPGGNWFGIQIPQNAVEAETLYNIEKWGNTIDKVYLYQLTQDVTGYLGKVAGGEGNQFFIPYSVKVGEVMKIVAERIFK